MDWLDEVRRALLHLRASDATEVEIVQGTFRLQVRRRPSTHAPLAAAQPAEPAAPVNGSAVVAPLTGVFYRAPSPTAAAYVEVGDEVAPDTVVGLIETMKIFNEVLAERSGRVAAVLAETGQLVHAGEALMTIEEPAHGQAGQATA